MPRLARRFLMSLAAILVIGAALFTWLAPPIVDDRYNSPLPYDAYRVGQRAQHIFGRIPGIADLHGDTLLWNRDLTKRNDRGHIDIPRLADGRVAIQVFGAVTKTPRGLNYDMNASDSDNITLLAIAQRWPVRTWGSLKERAFYQAEKLQRFADDSGGALVFTRTQADLAALLERRRSTGSGTAGFMGLEGAHALEGELANVDALFAAGYRMLGLAHFFDNEVSGSVHGTEKYGPTALGMSVVKRAQNLGMMIDVAHASHAAIADTLAITEAPLVFSHGGVKGVCNTNRNLTDDEIRAIAATGGIIGLGAWDAAACGTTPADLARAMAYVKALVGPQAVALGTDFDGAIKSAYTLKDYDALIAAMLDEGFTDAEVEAALIGNVLRVFQATLPKK